MKQIFFVTAWYPSESDPQDGIFVQEHAQAIAAYEKVHIVRIATAQSKKLPNISWQHEQLCSTLTKTTIHITAPILRWGIFEKLVVQAYEKVHEFLTAKHGKMDAIHLNVRDRFTKNIIKTSFFKQYPFFYTEHYTFYHSGIAQLDEKDRKSTIEEVTQWVKDANIKAFMPVSNQLGDVFVKQFGLPKNVVKIVANVANPLFKYVPKSTPQLFKLALAARWQENKDPATFFDALRLLPINYLTQLEIDWIGFGAQMPFIEEQVESLKDKVKINLHGRQTKDKIAELFQQAHVFVHPTVAENLPCVIIESLCCGTPVLSMSVNGIPEMVSEKDGQLVAAKAPQELANALQSMMDNYHLYQHEDIAKRAEIKYSASSIGAQISAVYKTEG